MLVLLSANGFAAVGQISWLARGKAKWSKGWKKLPSEIPLSKIWGATWRCHPQYRMDLLSHQPKQSGWFCRWGFLIRRSDLWQVDIKINQNRLLPYPRYPLGSVEPTLRSETAWPFKQLVLTPIPSQILEMKEGSHVRHFLEPQTVHGTRPSSLPMTGCVQFSS